MSFLCTAGGRANWNNSCGKSLYKLNTCLFHDWANPFQLEILYRSRHVCKQMLTHPCPRWQKNKDKNKTQLETTLNAEQEKTIESSVGFHTPKFHVFMKMNNAQLYMDALKTTLSETHNPDKTPHRIFYRLLVCFTRPFPIFFLQPLTRLNYPLRCLAFETLTLPFTPQTRPLLLIPAPVCH